MYFPLPALKSVDGWVLSIVIIAVVAIWQRLINITEDFNNLTQNKIKPLLQFIEAFWITVLVIASAIIWLGSWTGALVIVVQLALLFRARHCKQMAIEILAALLIFISLFYAYQGVTVVGSFRFSTLPLFAKLAVISAFLQLWLWSAFYRKYQPGSTLKNIAEETRILFYMIIPIFWVASVIRRFDEQALMILWLSPLLALFLAQKIKHVILVTETKILTVLASVTFVIGVSQLLLMHSLITLIGFSSYYGLGYWLNRKNPSDIYQFICNWGILTLGTAIPIIVAFQTGHLFYSVLTGIVYWGVLFNLTIFSEHLKRNETLITLINIVLVVLAWLFMFKNAYYVMVPMLFLLFALYQKQQRFLSSILGKTFKLNSDLFLHSIGVISYVVFLLSFNEYRLTLFIAPALAMHGALILFLKDRRLTTVKYGFALMLLGIIKLALIDAASALLWQKVILFMGIGVFILLASFWYQKLVGNADKASVESV